jgi:hypothetical protein
VEHSGSGSEGGPKKTGPVTPRLSPAWEDVARIQYQRLSDKVKNALPERLASEFEKGIVDAQTAYSTTWISAVLERSGLGPTKAASNLEALIGKTPDRTTIWRWSKKARLTFSSFQAFYIRFAAQHDSDHPLRRRGLWDVSGYLSAARGFADLLAENGESVRSANRENPFRIPVAESFLGLHYYHLRSSPSDIMGKRDRETAKAATRKRAMESIGLHFTADRPPKIDDAGLESAIAALGLPWVVMLWFLEGRPARSATDGQRASLSPAAYVPALHDGLTFTL